MKQFMEIEGRFLHEITELTKRDDFSG